MTNDFQLKVMAYLDGELSGREAQEIAALLEKDPEARALGTELRLTREALRGNEPELKLPESREFFWSKIEQSILHEEQAGARVPTARSWWQLWWVRTACASAVALAALLPVLIHGHRSEDSAMVENPLADSGTFSFRSESERMTVVWIYDRDQDSAETSDVSERVL